MIVTSIQIWAGIGLLVALAFVTIGINRIDEDAVGAYAFRPLIIPGVVLIWPVVLWRWWILEAGNDDWKLRHAPPRRSHGPVWIVLAILIPLTFLTALLLRQTWPEGYVPERLEQDEGQNQ
jgi:hypothetical protein